MLADHKVIEINRTRKETDRIRSFALTMGSRISGEKCAVYIVGLAKMHGLRYANPTMRKRYNWPRFSPNSLTHID